MIKSDEASPFIGSVVSLYETPNFSKMMRVRWFYKQENFDQKLIKEKFGIGNINPKEIFYSDYTDVNPVSFIISLCNVIWPIEIGEIPSLIKPNSFICQYKYFPKPNDFMKLQLVDGNINTGVLFSPGLAVSASAAGLNDKKVTEKVTTLIDDNLTNSKRSRDDEIDLIDTNIINELSSSTSLKIKKTKETNSSSSASASAFKEKNKSISNVTEDYTQDSPDISEQELQSPLAHQKQTPLSQSSNSLIEKVHEEKANSSKYRSISPGNNNNSKSQSSNSLIEKAREEALSKANYSKFLSISPGINKKSETNIKKKVQILNPFEPFKFTVNDTTLELNLYKIFGSNEQYKNISPMLQNLTWNHILSENFYDILCNNNEIMFEENKDDIMAFNLNQLESVPIAHKNKLSKILKNNFAIITHLTDKSIAILFDKNNVKLLGLIDLFKKFDTNSDIGNPEYYLIIFIKGMNAFINIDTLSKAVESRRIEETIKYNSEVFLSESNDFEEFQASSFAYDLPVLNDMKSSKDTLVKVILYYYNFHLKLPPQHYSPYYTYIL